MAFTRFHDDSCRIQKYLEETTNIGNYEINVPGNGINMPFINDPHLRMQKWGANLSKFDGVAMIGGVTLMADKFIQKLYKI